MGTVVPREPREPMLPARRGSGGGGKDRRALDVRGPRRGRHERDRGGRERAPRDRGRGRRERDRTRERERPPRERGRAPREREREPRRAPPRKRPLSASPEYSYCYEYTDDEESYSYEPSIPPHRSTPGGSCKRRR